MGVLSSINQCESWIIRGGADADACNPLTGVNERRRAVLKMKNSVTAHATDLEPYKRPLDTIIGFQLCKYLTESRQWSPLYICKMHGLN